MTNHPQLRVLPRQFIGRFHRVIGRSVIDDQYLKLPRQIGQHIEQMSNVRGQGCLGIMNRQHDTKRWIHNEPFPPEGVPSSF